MPPLRRMKAPASREAFTKQTFNTVPNASLDDAKTWLAQQIDTWRKITERSENRDTE